VFARAGHDLFRILLRLVVQLWPLWVFWFAWTVAANVWLDYLLTFPNRSNSGYALAYRAWPSIALLGPVLLMLAAVFTYRVRLATRMMPIAGIAGVVVATLLTAWPEYQRLAPYLGHASPFAILGALDLGVL
jgi:type IV secretion system protein VirD4